MGRSTTKPRHHPLKVWRFEHGITLAQLAKRVGVFPSAISLIENRKRQPSLHLAQAIVRETGGAITFADFVLEKSAKS
jgi:transcriptional regulator with XRE-family HTH domain